ncbi:Nucleosome-remodeling factor subunit BPTF [Trametes pubescens]|uniref:Nucleosome-remodeling factor subunit BPTF n=1 Tax=Trametes pubescens TaxID=154538 RepID=A0A1M2VZJ5_TRAPU|nr:Nucleosome-remodeling factor subunit BPTF [Trametes pubescens]
MSQSTPPNDRQQSPYSQRTPNSLQSPSMPFGYGSPPLRGDELYAAPSRLRSASQTQSGSPPSVVSRTSSATALPNLLNAEPPRSPAVTFGSHGSPGGLGALEALVQAATEERRRLSGELPTPMERKESARRASISPVLNRNPPPLPTVSPVSQKSPPLPSLRLDVRVNSLAFISLSQTPSQDSEPPTKRRRRTGSFNTSLPVLPGPAPILSADPAPSTSTSPVAPTRIPTSPVVPDTVPSPASYTSPSVPASTLAAAAQVRSPTPPSPTPLPPSPPPDLSIAKFAVAAVSPTVEPPLSPPAVPAILAAPVVLAVPAPSSPYAPPPPTLPATSKPISISQLLVSEPPVDYTPSVVDAVRTPPPHEPSPEPMPTSPIAPVVEPSPEPLDEKTAIDIMEAVPEPSVAESSARVETPETPPLQLMEEVQPVEVIPAEAVPDEVISVDTAAQAIPMEAVSVDAVQVDAVQVDAAPLDAAPVDTVPEDTSSVDAVPVDVPLAQTVEADAVPVETVKVEEMPDASLAASETLGRPLVVPTDIPREQDAHEWLLEHYATDSPASVSRRASPAPEEPPDSPAPSNGSPPPEVKPEEVQMAPVSPEPAVDEIVPAAKIVKARSRTPTPLALLEEELDRATPDERIIPDKAASPTSDADLAMELDLAASASREAVRDVDVSMSNELDDELLSLLDEEPRHSHSHSHVHSRTHTHTHSHSQAASHPPKPSHTSAGSPRLDRHLDKVFSAAKPPDSSAPPAVIAPAPSELVVMPPPIAPPGLAAKQAAVSQQQPSAKSQKTEALTASASSKKKEPAAKALQKAKPTAKPKAKAAAAKSKAKPAVKEGTAGSSGRLTPSGSGSVAKGKKTAATNAVAASAAKRSVSAAVGQSRSRSASVMPAPPEPASKPQEEEEEEEEEVVDDKLYCICKTSYDEDRVMIACDRCDEWYHTQCLKMDDLEVDLIDQFVCPPCIKANPHLLLKTTYKKRCFAGLQHPRPSSAAACHKPARGAFSKFCSDDCGITYMQRRIESWGGEESVLWASVRDVKQREGVVVKVHLVKEEPKPTRRRKPEPRAVAQNQLLVEAYEVQRPTKSQRERAIARLQGELFKIAPKREVLKDELEVILWRQKVLELAAARAERVQECGWDQRLCLDDDEYGEYAAGVLESYEEGHANGDDAMQVDGTVVEDGAWWCTGKKKCPRHVGWQKLRANELEFDQELKEKAMSALTTQEREIRRQLEDVISLESRQPSIMVPGPIPQPVNGHTQGNGTAKSKTNGTSQKKGKQKN